MKPYDVEPGRCASTQIPSRPGAIAWTHRGRFGRGLELVARRGGGR